jgi:hypothetical protein
LFSVLIANQHAIAGQPRARACGLPPLPCRRPASRAGLKIARAPTPLLPPRLTPMAKMGFRAQRVGEGSAFGLRLQEPKKHRRSVKGRGGVDV